MSIEKLEIRDIKRMFLYGAKHLQSKRNYVDELNVFPVPDGDTGTNMSMTIMAAAKEVAKVDDTDVLGVTKAMSTGSLRGARGNSGVILSQLIRGFSKEIGAAESITAKILAEAFKKGAETAYKAVMKPKEGTILTVAKGAADKAEEIAKESMDIHYMLKSIIDYAEEVLQKTPDMLPVLKEAGVVDAGGQGLLFILRGALIALEDPTVDVSDLNVVESSAPKVEKEMSAIEKASGEITFGYCTEFIINAHKDKETEKESESLKSFLETIGDSIVAVCDDETIKVHVHTNDPGMALQKALAIGSLMNIKIDNMRIQHEHLVNELPADYHGTAKAVQEERKEVGFIAVSIGSGLNEIFKGLGVDQLIEGGQTMNPSTEDVLNAISKVNAEHVFVLPNNKNIILAANQAAELCEDKKIHVIQSKTIPQGITAMINYQFEKDALQNVEVMSEAIGLVRTGQVTYAVRDTVIEGKEIKEGNYLGIGDSKIESTSDSLTETVFELVDTLMSEGGEMVTIYYGAEVTLEEAEGIAEYISNKYTDAEVAVERGGQPLYYYLLSVE